MHLGENNRYSVNAESSSFQSSFHVHQPSIGHMMLRPSGGNLNSIVLPNVITNVKLASVTHTQQFPNNTTAQPPFRNSVGVSPLGSPLSSSFDANNLSHLIRRGNDEVSIDKQKQHSF